MLPAVADAAPKPPNVLPVPDGAAAVAGLPNMGLAVAAGDPNTGAALV